MNYRPDIDGLRAFAVGAVIVNHAFPEILRGGFIGVDVFFVISGFLITSIIHRDLKAGTFSTTGFYARRFRRILPAFFFMLVVILPIALLVLPPNEFSMFAGSIAAASAFISNHFFWAQTGYFAGDASAYALLHTWSLSVEEQFYLFFPPIMFMAHRIGGTRFLLVAGAALSFAASLYAVTKFPTAAFYLLPTRAWELLLGSILAVLPVWRLPIATARGLSYAGLLIVVGGAVLLSSKLPFPGATALIPCLGASLIIGASHSNNQLLTNRVAVYIGRISYSLYLWHWPVLSLARSYFGTSYSPVVAVACVTISFAAADLSLRFVEGRFRLPAGASVSTGRRFSDRATVITGIGGLAIVAALSWGLMEAARNPAVVEAFYSSTDRYLVEASLRTGIEDTCLGRVSSDCIIGDRDIPPGIALWGDSYADAIQKELGEALQGKKSSAAFILHSCPSILGVLRVDERSDFNSIQEKCSRFNKDVFEHLRSRPLIDTVILFSAYSAQIDRLPARLVPIGGGASSESERKARLIKSIATTARDLIGIGKKVIVIGAMHTETRLGAESFLRQNARGQYDTSSAIIPAHLYDVDTKYINDALRAQLPSEVVLINPKDIFCPALGASGSCDYAPEGLPLLIDDGHLSVFGARALVSRLVQAL